MNAKIITEAANWLIKCAGVLFMMAALLQAGYEAAQKDADQISPEHAYIIEEPIKHESMELHKG